MSDVQNYRPGCKYTLAETLYACISRVTGSDDYVHGRTRSQSILAINYERVVTHKLLDLHAEGVELFAWKM